VVMGSCFRRDDKVAGTTSFTTKLLLPSQRRHRRDLLAFRAPAENLGGQDRMIESLQMQIIQRLA
jgi:hypothetical protein